MGILRECRTCGVRAYTEDQLNLFRKNKKLRFGRDNECKECFNKRSYKAKTLKQERYQWEAVQMLGGKCEGCDKEATRDTMVCFDFHHTDKTTKVANVSNIIKTKTLAKVLEEAEKCILFCACCHRLHHQKYGY
jgi:hypothetical protein